MARYRRRVRSRSSVVVVVVFGVIATAGATAPCFEVCHLSQSQPLLVDNEIWVRPCATVKGKHSCVLQRLDVEGRVLATLPGDDLYDEEKFEQKHLANRTVARLFYQTAWSDLRKPYTVSSKTSTMTLRLDKTNLICERTSGVIKRPLGCKPSALSVRAGGMARDSSLEDPTGVAVVIATCGAGKTTRDVIAVCQARPPSP